jgi:hypothetical protein
MAHTERSKVIGKGEDSGDKEDKRSTDMLH